MVKIGVELLEAVKNSHVNPSKKNASAQTAEAGIYASPDLHKLHFTDVR